MRRAIIHVGMPRTASTTIQHVLAHRRAGLLAAGVLYPDLTPASAAHAPHISHQHLGEALDGRRSRAERGELLDKLSQQIAHTDADVLLLSYEDWIQEKRAGAIARRLRDAVARHGFRLEAVVVAKPQAEHVNSVYAHRCQLMREKELFAPFAGRFQASRRLAYAELLDPWLDACDGRVRAVPLRDHRSAAPLIERFLAELDLLPRVAPLLDAAEGQRVENRSPGPIAVEVSRRLRLLRVPSRLPLQPRAAMRLIEADVAERGFDRVPFKGVDPAMRARLEERFGATNDRFAHAVWGSGWDSVVKPAPRSDPNEIGDHPIAAETEQLIRELTAAALARWRLPSDPPWHTPLVEAAETMLARAGRALRVSSWRVT